MLADLEVPRGAASDSNWPRPLRKLVRLGGVVTLSLTLSPPLLQHEKQAGENDRILVFGSFYTVAAVMRALKERP